MVATLALSQLNRGFFFCHSKSILIYTNSYHLLSISYICTAHSTTGLNAVHLLPDLILKATYEAGTVINLTLQRGN